MRIPFTRSCPAWNSRLSAVWLKFEGTLTDNERQFQWVFCFFIGTARRAVQRFEFYRPSENSETVKGRNVKCKSMEKGALVSTLAQLGER